MSLLRAAGPGERFRRWGIIGVGIGFALVWALATPAQLPPGRMGVLAASAFPAFLLIAWILRALTGRRTLIHYRELLLTLGAEAVLARMLGLPVLAAMDVLILGVGAFAACGRLGCLAAGCCHGRPWRHGVRYGAAHVRAGFPRYYAGVPLFPLQAVEAAGIAVLVAGGGALVLAGPPRPGVVLGAYLAGYALLRFVLEFGRGDTCRGFAAGFSTAQWTSAALAALVAAVAWFGPHPVSFAWLIPIATILGVGATVRGLRGGSEPFSGLRHRAELAAALARLERHGRLDARDGRLRVARTSAGLRLSASHVAGRLRHLSFSRLPQSLSRREARAVARALAALRPDTPAAALLTGPGGAWHLVLDPPRGG